MGDAIAWAVGRFIAGLFVVAFVLGGLAVWGLPKLWHSLKPFIHQVTE